MSDQAQYYNGMHVKKVQDVNITSYHLTYYYNLTSVWPVVALLGQVNR